MKIQTCLLTLLTLIVSTKTYALYFDTLPQGVRMIIGRQVFSKSITREFDPAKDLSPTTIEVDFDAEALSGIEEIIDQAQLDRLKEVDPALYDNFTLGEWRIEGNASVKAFGMGFAYGLRKNLTVYASIPYMRAKVNMKAVQLKKDNLAETNKALQLAGENGQFNGLVADINSFPTDGPTLQSVIMNNFGYQPVGDWEGQGFGDLELGFKLQLYNWETSGMAMSLGLKAPTGREDNPDIIQDIAFGDGYWSVFGEFGGGKRFSSLFFMDSYLKATLGLPDSREERIANDEDFSLASEKGTFKIIPGAAIEYSLMAGFELNDWITIQPEYLYKYAQKDKYESPYTIANRALAANSEEEQHVAKLTIDVSSINAFLKKEFLLPAKIIFGAEHTFAGKNVPELTLGYIEFRMLF